MLLFMLLLVVRPGWAGASDLVFSLSSGAEVVCQRYPATGKVLAIWLTGQYGRTEEEHLAAADLAAHGVETWIADFLAPYFLPLLPSSLSQVPDRDLAEWLEAVRKKNPDRRIVLVSTGRVSSLALRTARMWREMFGTGGNNPLAGALLMFPLLYQEFEPGKEPEYDPVVAQSQLDLVILQPKSSAGYWWRDRLKNVLEHAGSRVWINVLPGLRDGFYRRSDINAQESAAGARLGAIMLDALKPLIEKEK